MSKLILVIDDSLTIRKTIEIVLRREGYETRCFPDGPSAITWLHFSRAVPDLFLIDLQMPKMDGYSLIRLLRSYSALSKIPIVIISRHDGLIDHLKGRLLGAVAYIAKPFTTNHLLSIVQTYLGVPAVVPTF